MAGHSELLARYRELRAIGARLIDRLVEDLPKHVLEQGANQLGLVQRGRVGLPTTDAAAILGDFCVHDIWHDGTNAIEDILTKSPPSPNSDEIRFLQAMRDSCYTIFVVDEVEKGVGVHVRDVGGNAFFLVDVSFSTTATKGGVMAGRIMQIDGMHMTTGAALPVGMIANEQQRQAVNSLVKQLGVHEIPRLSPQEASPIVAKTIRVLIQAGRASKLKIVEPEDLDSDPRLSDFHAASEEDTYERQVPVLAHGGAPHVGRNDRCPCGSGKKFKHCCGGRR